MYDLNPSPQKKKRPHSLPAHGAAYDDDLRSEDIRTALEVEEGVPETSQAQPEDDPLADIRERVDPLVSTHPRKQRGRFRESVGIMSSPVPSNTGNVKVQAASRARGKSRPTVEEIPSSPPLSLQDKDSAVSDKSGGQPRKSGESHVFTHLPAIEKPTEQKNLVLKAKQKVHTEDGQNTAASTATTAGQRSSQPPKAKKRRRLNGPTMISPDTAEFEEIATSPILTARKPPQLHAELSIERKKASRLTRSHTAAVNKDAATNEHSATAIIEAKYIGAKPESSLRGARKTKPALLQKPTKLQTVDGFRSSEQEVQVREGLDVDVTPTSGDVQLGERNAFDAIDAEARGDERQDIGEIASMQPDNEAIDQHESEPGREEDDDDDDDEEVRQADEEIDQHATGSYSEEENVSEGVRQANEDQGGGGNTDTVDAPDAGTADARVHRSLALDEALQFVNSEERSGGCRTRLGKEISRSCTRARVTLSRSGDDSPSLEDISDCSDDLVRLLTSTNSRVREERRIPFKLDAFAHLFRDITLVMAATSSKVEEIEGELTGSISALRIVYNLVRNTLVFKDTIDSWKVKVPQQRQGDRLIKGVENGLITPLRAVEKEFRRPLGQFERAEQSRQAMEEAQRKREAEEQELIKREEELRSTVDRRRRWQDLHIARNQCEPDPMRRRRLRFVEPARVQETDANGRPFQRVPVFGERSVPPPQWMIASSGREWSEEQELVLLDELKSFVGRYTHSSNLQHIVLTVLRSFGAYLHEILWSAGRTTRLLCFRFCGEDGLGPLHVYTASATA